MAEQSLNLLLHFYFFYVQDLCSSFCFPFSFNNNSSLSSKNFLCSSRYLKVFSSSQLLTISKIFGCSFYTKLCFLNSPFSSKNLFSSSSIIIFSSSKILAINLLLFFFFLVAVFQLLLIYFAVFPPLNISQFIFIFRCCFLISSKSFFSPSKFFLFCFFQATAFVFLIKMLKPHSCLTQKIFQKLLCFSFIYFLLLPIHLLFILLFFCF